MAATFSSLEKFIEVGFWRSVLQFVFQYVEGLIQLQYLQNSKLVTQNHLTLWFLLFLKQEIRSSQIVRTIFHDIMYKSSLLIWHAFCPTFTKFSRECVRSTYALADTCKPKTELRPELRWNNFSNETLFALI